MKEKSFCTLALLSLSLLLANNSQADTNYGVSTPNGGADFRYWIDGQTPPGAAGDWVNNCQPLTLYAGHTYTFDLTNVAAFHPMVVATNAATSSLDPASNFAYKNASPQDTSTGTITLTIPATDFPSTLYYQCNVHGFYGVITVLPPPTPPPPNEIVSLSVTTNIVLISTGTTNSFVLIPQFSSNLVGGAWANVQFFSNFFAGGTNTTVFDRLDPICGPNVFLRISQQPP